MQGTFGQIDYVPLPSRFAARVRAGSLTVGISLVVGTLIVFGLTRFLQGMTHGRPFADTLAGLVVQALPPVTTVLMAAVVLSSFRCLRGDYLVVATARATRAALRTVLAASVVVTLAAVVVPVLTPIWTAQPLDRTPDLLSPFADLVFTGIGFLAGMFYVRPSENTLRKFSDHPIW